MFSGRTPLGRVARVIFRILIFGLLLGLSFWLNEWKELLPARFFIYQHVFGIGRATMASHVGVVMITDKEHYEKDCSGVRPTASYLPGLLSAIADRHPAVIAVDLVLRTSGEDSRQRLRNLVDRIQQINMTGTTPIVLTEVLSERKHDRQIEFVRAPGAFAELIWNLPNRTELFPRVTSGYFRLADDPRQIPWKITAKELNGTQVDIKSFAVAIAAAKNKRATVLGDQYDEFPFARFWKKKTIPTVSASQLLDTKPEDVGDVEYAIRNRAVIIGGEWHEDGCGLGAVVDEIKSTPLGPLQGAYLHATYVESILSDIQFYRGLGQCLLFTFDVVAVLLLAGASRYLRRRTRLQRSPFWSIAVAATVIAAGLLVISAGLACFGIYFDVLIPCLVVWVHGIVDDYRYAKEGLQKIREELQQCQQTLELALHRSSPQL